MPFANVRGIRLQYEVLGGSGPWIALSPGGRRDMNDIRSLGIKVASHGYRVLIHDRRNCGLSDIAIDAKLPEYEVWADDLRELLLQLDALPAVIGGGSSGCRLSMLFALKYPNDTRALLLWRITGGQFALQRLEKKYYTLYLDAARKGGMAAVCEVEHFKELIEAKPENRAVLMAMNPAEFIAAIESWRVQFVAGAEEPVIGATVEQLRSINVPTCIIPGNDRTHNHAVAELAHQLIPNSKLYDLFPGDTDAEILPMSAWEPKEDAMSTTLANFIWLSTERAA